MIPIFVILYLVVSCAEMYLWSVSSLYWYNSHIVTAHSFLTLFSYLPSSIDLSIYNNCWFLRLVSRSSRFNAGSEARPHIVCHLNFTTCIAVWTSLCSLTFLFSFQFHFFYLFSCRQHNSITAIKRQVIFVLVTHWFNFALQTDELSRQIKTSLNCVNLRWRKAETHSF